VWYGKIPNRLHDLPVKHQEAMANPEALELFRGQAELQRQSAVGFALS
jgi:hypothetical protein